MRKDVLDAIARSPEWRQWLERQRAEMLEVERIVDAARQAGRCVRGLGRDGRFHDLEAECAELRRKLGMPEKFGTPTA